MYLILIFFLGPILAFKLLLDRGYKVSYDDRAVYQRPLGVTRRLGFLPEQMIAYQDIGSIQGDPGRMIQFGIMPFSYVRVYRRGWDGEELFWLSPFCLDRRELKALLWFIHAKRPDAFSQEVIDYMNNDKL